MAIRMFFIPQSEITSQIINRIGQRRAKRLRQAAADAAQQAEPEHAESGELLTAVADALENKAETVTRDDWSDRRWLSEIIYHFMGRLAGRSQRGGSNAFKIPECFLDGMRTRLGLHEAEDEALLKELANQFSYWLSQQENRSFPAGWGRIVGNAQDPDSLTFKPLERVASEASSGSYPAVK